MAGGDSSGARRRSQGRAAAAAVARLRRRRTAAAVGEGAAAHECPAGSTKRCMASFARCPRADFAPRERATIAEVLRDQVAYLHTELARRYAGKPQPAVRRELRSRRPGDRAVAGAVGAVFRVPQAAARRRPRARRRQAEAPAARPLRRQAAGASSTASRGACRRPRCGRSSTRTTGWPKCSNAR